MTDFSKWKTALSCKKFDGAAFDSYKKFGIELIEISPRREDYPALNWAEIKSESERTGVKIWSVHLPFSRDINISLPDRKKTGGHRLSAFGLYAKGGGGWRKGGCNSSQLRAD